jgi:hypothetical protein
MERSCAGKSWISKAEAVGKCNPFKLAKNHKYLPASRSTLYLLASSLQPELIEQAIKDKQISANMSREKAQEVIDLLKPEAARIRREDADEKKEAVKTARKAEIVAEAEELVKRGWWSGQAAGAAGCGTTPEPKGEGDATTPEPEPQPEPEPEGTTEEPTGEPKENDVQYAYICLCVKLDARESLKAGILALLRKHGITGASIDIGDMLTE